MSDDMKYVSQGLINDFQSKEEAVEKFSAAEEKIKQIAEEMLSDRLQFTTESVIGDYYYLASYVEITVTFEQWSMRGSYTLEYLESSDYDIVRYDLKRVASELGQKIFLKEPVGGER